MKLFLLLLSSVIAQIVDVQFIVDVSSDSMPPYLNRVKSQINWIVSHSPANAQYALMTVGGSNTQIQQLSQNISQFNQALSNLAIVSANQESSLSAIRQALQSNTWRSTASKVIMLFTDEDSDSLSKDNSNAYCATLQSDASTCSAGFKFEPSFQPASFQLSTSTNQKGGQFLRNAGNIQLTSTFQSEVNEVVQLASQSNVMLVIFNSPEQSHNKATGPISVFDQTNPLFKGTPDNRTTQMMQFGDPSVQCYTDPSFWSGFDVYGTLQRLNANGLATSLQAQILQQGHQMRMYDIEIFNELDGRFTSDQTDQVFQLVANDVFKNLTNTPLTPPPKNGTSFYVPLAPPSGEGDHNNAAATAGIIIGVVVSCAALATAAVLYRRRKSPARDSLAMGSLQNNPLYSERTTTHENAVYQGSQENLNVSFK